MLKKIAKGNKKLGKRGIAVIEGIIFEKDMGKRHPPQKKVVQTRIDKKKLERKKDKPKKRRRKANSEAPRKTKTV